MIITKNSAYKMFITTFIIIIITNSYQLHAMKSEIVKTNDEIAMDKDFQAYKLLSLIDNDHHCYLLPELVKTIATKVSQLIDKECSAEYDDKEFLNHPISFFRFITDKQCTMDHISMANIIKRCLRYSKKSLGEIKGYDETTVFHLATGLPVLNNNNDGLIKLLCLIAGDEAWDIICIKNNTNETSLYLNLWSAEAINTLLSMAPNSQKAWDLIITPNNNHRTH